MGRQGTGYEKMILMQSQWPIPFDVYLLRFKVGSKIPAHVDEVEYGDHYRLDIILKHAKSGGQFICNTMIKDRRWLKLFRPDKHVHELTPITKGTRYVLSIGWLKNPIRKNNNDSRTTK